MFIQSFFDYEMTFIKGLMIPKHNYNVMEMEAGKQNIIEVTDEQLEQMKKDKMFNELISKKKYRILDKKPYQYRDTEEKVRDKEKEITALKEELQRIKKSQELLEKQLKEKKGKKTDGV